MKGKFYPVQNTYTASGAAPLMPAPGVRRPVARFGLGRFREILRDRIKDPGSPGAVQPLGSLPGNTSMLPHRVSLVKKPAFWNYAYQYKRQEFLVSPPDLPGTAIRYTLFHPVYIPGLQGYKDTLPFNYQWIWGRNTNFTQWNMLGKMVQATVTGRGRQQNVWKPAMQPQPFGNARAWRQPRPYYTPPIINPGSS